MATLEKTKDTRTLEPTKDKGIYKRGGRYVVVYRDPRGRQRKRFARTRREARDLKAALRTDIRRGEFRDLSHDTLAEYASEWIESYTGRTRRGLGDGTRDDYRGALEREIIPVLGRLRIAEIEPRDIKRLATSLAARGLAATSVTKTIAPLKALLATAVEEGDLRSNPAAGLRIAQPAGDDVNEGEERAKALTEDELGRILVKLPQERRFFFDFLSQTGLRIGEAIELRFGDVDGTWLRVHRRFYRGRVGLPKGRKKRSVPISRELAQQLWALRKERRASDADLIFTSAKGMRIDTSNLMSRILKPAAIDADLGEWVREDGHLRPKSWVGFHTFRHTAATRLFIGQGWNAAQVCRFLGHTDPGFTLRTYVHLLPEDLPVPDFGGNAGATEATETGRNADARANAVPPAEQGQASVGFGAAGA
jgi:integrase